MSMCCVLVTYGERVGFLSKIIEKLHSLSIPIIAISNNASYATVDYLESYSKCGKIFVLLKARLT